MAEGGVKGDDEARSVRFSPDGRTLANRGVRRPRALLSLLRTALAEGERDELPGLNRSLQHRALLVDRSGVGLAG
jgi:hypothetical protein